MSDKPVPEPMPEPVSPDLVRPAFGCGVPECPFEPTYLFFWRGRPYVVCSRHSDRKSCNLPDLMEADLFQMPDEWRERMRRAAQKLLSQAEATEEQKRRSMAQYRHSLERAEIGLRDALKEQEMYRSLLTEIGESPS